MSVADDPVFDDAERFLTPMFYIDFVPWALVAAVLAFFTGCLGILLLFSF